VRGDGSIDDKEVSVLEGVAAWMDVNKESIFDTRPWKVFGEGPAAEASNPMTAEGFNEGKVKYSGKDLRFNQKGNVLYVTTLGIPDANIMIKNLGTSKETGAITKVEFLGSKEKVKWTRTADQLQIDKTADVPNKIALVYKVYLKK